MKSANKRQEQLAQLRALDHAATKLRDQLGVSGIGEVIWRARDLESDMLVEADGYGGAKIVVVEGNYPLDYLIISKQVVKTEQEACCIAQALTDKKEEQQ